MLFHDTINAYTAAISSCHERFGDRIVFILDIVIYAGVKDSGRCCVCLFAPVGPTPGPRSLGVKPLCGSGSFLSPFPSLLKDSFTAGFNLN